MGICCRFLLDLNMTPFFGWSENEWVALGPGSLSCIRKIFGPSVRGHEEEALRYIHSTQYDHFARLRLSHCIPRLSPGHRPGLSMVDIEHSLCEVEKYSREHSPEIKGKRHQIKSRFRQTMKQLTADIPEHWKDDSEARSLPSHPPPVAITSDSEPLYEVSHIVAERQHVARYLVRWTGYGPDDDTWESEENLSRGAKGVLDRWKSMKARIDSKVADFQSMGETYRSRKKPTFSRL